jgi:hypothetical protein
MMLTGPVWAQTLPGGLTREQMQAIPPDVLKNLPAVIWMKIPLSTPKAIPPALLAKIPPEAATMTPEQAKAYYRRLDPARQKSLKELAKDIKARIDSVPGLMDKLKALANSVRGS